MNSVLLPIEFFDLPEICDLLPEYKLVLGFCATNPSTSPAAVLVATPRVLSTIPLKEDTFWGIVADLGRRGLVEFDQGTREIFILKSFEWHRSPAPEEDSPWARQVLAGVARIRSLWVREAVQRAILVPCQARLASLKIPSNLMTALPFRGPGREWSATEMLVHFALAVDPLQSSAGVFRLHLPAAAAFCSLPCQTVLEAVESLAAAQALFFDSDTGEVFSPARLRAAGERDVKKIKEAAGEVRSRLIFGSLRCYAKRKFPTMTLESYGCLSVEGSGRYVRKGESAHPPIGDWFSNDVWMDYCNSQNGKYYLKNVLNHRSWQKALTEPKTIELVWSWLQQRTKPKAKRVA